MFRVRTTFGGLSGSPYLSTMYFSETTPGGVTAQQCVTTVGNFWAAIDNNLSNSMTWSTEADVAQIDETDGEITGTVGTTPASGIGGLSTTRCPTAVQGLVRWSTGFYFNGRHRRGRTFIPGIVVAQTLDNAPASTLTTLVNTAAASFISDANTVPVIWSRTAGGYASIIGGTMWNTLAILRSRRD
jgi:hypothetical protein